MLDKIGVSVDWGIRESTRRWLIRQLEDDSQEFDVEDLEGMGKREPDNVDTFRD